MEGLTNGISPPTSHLAPIKQISSQDVDSLRASIHYLHTIYNPEVRGSRRRQKPSLDTDWCAPAKGTMAENEKTLTLLRTDNFERSYAIKWLTRLIAHFGSSGGDGGEDVELDVANSDVDHQARLEKLVQEAAALLAVCAGTASAGTITRKFMFLYHRHRHRHPHSEFDTGCGEENIPISVNLTDISLDNQDYGSVGAQTWGGACVLSEMIVENPGSFGLDDKRLRAYGSRGDVFRILELGSGTGLVSLVVGKLLREVMLPACEERRVEIVSTDYYSPVMNNLRDNVQRNVDVGGGLDSSIVHLVHELDWSRFGEKDTRDPPFDRPFDLVLGADIVYEADHAAWIRSCLGYLLRKIPPQSQQPGDAPAVPPLFHLVIPLRATHRLESSTIETIFREAVTDVGQVLPSLRVKYKEIIVCDGEAGEEVEYSYYKIGWS